MNEQLAAPVRFLLPKRDAPGTSSESRSRGEHDDATPTKLGQIGNPRFDDNDGPYRGGGLGGRSAAAVSDAGSLRPDLAGVNVRGPLEWRSGCNRSRTARRG